MNNTKEICQFFFTTEKKADIVASNKRKKRNFYLNFKLVLVKFLPFKYQFNLTSLPV